MSGSSFAVVLLAAVSALPAPAAQKKAARKQQAPAYGIVAGTVFRDPGFALADAKVTLYAPGGPKPKKLQEAATNFRGEFEFRVPPVAGTYLVRASSKGYRTEEKQTSVAAEEQVEVNLVLSPEK